MYDTQQVEQRIYKPDDFREAPAGIYKIVWKNGRTSLAHIKDEGWVKIVIPINTLKEYFIQEGLKEEEISSMVLLYCKQVD